MPNLDRRWKTVVAVGLATLIGVSLLSVAVAFSNETQSFAGFGQSEGIIFQTFKSPIMPVDQLLMDPRAFVAVVEPLERGAVYEVGQEELSDFGVDMEAAQRGGGWPFTPVTVKVLEVVKGEVPETIVLWEERGVVPGLTVDSSDPYLEPGRRGLLIFANVEDRWFPIVFAEIDSDGRIAALDTTLREIREVLGQSG